MYCKARSCGVSECIMQAFEREILGQIQFCALFKNLLQKSVIAGFCKDLWVEKEDRPKPVKIGR
ncbi:hypothetical protein GCM10027340_26560 [Marinomonas epiphytica]